MLESVFLQWLLWLIIVLGFNTWILNMACVFHNDFETETLPPQPLLEWLTYSESLTQRLQDKIKQLTPHLKILRQSWRQVNWWEINVLNLKPSEQVFHREIMTFVQESPCWYARTIIPDETYQSHQPFFNRLEHENLGQLIFNHQNIARLKLQYYPITPNLIEYHWLKPVFLTEKRLWGRVSTFTINHHCLFFLIEIFLPDLLKVTNEVA